MGTDDLSNKNDDDGVKDKEVVDDEKDEEQFASHHTTVIRSELTPAILGIELAGITHKDIIQ